ncbi:TPA: transposase [Klebsiella oxytoca]
MALTEELNELDESLDKLTRKYAGNLRSQVGVGPQTAATLLAVAGDNPERLKNEAALASLCGVNPLPASSGKTVRHRLNRGGSRGANNALWTIALVRMRSDPRTRIYVDRRTGEGLSTIELAVRFGDTGNSASLAGEKSTLNVLSLALILHTLIPGSAEELLSHDCLGFSRDGRVLPWNVPDENGGMLQLEPTIRHIVSHGEALRDTAVRGMGIAFLSTWLAGDEIAKGELWIIPVKTPEL